MRVLIFISVVVCCSVIDTTAQRFWVATTPSNWNNTANWSATSGGPGGATVPINGQDVRFDAMGTGDCLLDVNVVVDGISMMGYTGVLDINNHNFTTTGTNTFESGVINNNGTTTLAINTVTSTFFNGTVFNTSVTGSTGRVFFNGSVFNQPITITKTSTGLDEGIGNNIFNATVNITTTGHGITFGKGMPDQFNDVVTFNNQGTFRIVIAHSHSGQTTTFANDVFMNANKSGGTDGWAFQIAEGTGSSVFFGGNVFIDCAGSLLSNFRFLEGLNSTATYMGTVNINVTNTHNNTILYMGTKGLSLYNNDITINNNGVSTDILFNTATTASSTLAPGRNIQIGNNGFTSGELRLSRFSQIGPTNQTLVLTGSAMLTVGPNAQFGGDVIFTAPRLNLDGATYQGTAVLTKTGAGDDAGDGGNSFAGSVELVNSGSGYLLSANLNPDIFNGNLTVTTTGTGTIRLAHNVAGTQFNSNVVVNSVNGGGVFFSSNLTGSAIFNVNSTISVGALGFNAGVLQLFRLTLSAPQSLLLDQGGSAILTLGQGSVFNSTITASAPGILLNGAIFNGAAELTKTGSSNNTGNGGNVFASSAQLINAGSGFLRTANTAPDVFNQDLIVTTTGSGSIQLAHNVIGTQFNGNVIVNSVYGGGVTFSSDVDGSSTFNTTSTISVGALGFNSGVLQLFRLTLSAPQSLLLDQGGSAILTLGQGSVFNSTITANAPGILLNGAIFNGAAELTKTGSSNNTGNGGNVFASSAQLINAGSGFLRTANTAPDIFNQDLIVTTTGSGSIQLAHNVIGTQFNGNVIVNSVNGGGVTFSSDVDGSSTFNTTSTISVGALGFNSGVLQLFRLTLTPAHSFELSGTAILTLGEGAVFMDDFTVIAPGIVLSGATYNGTATLTKTGSSNNDGLGGNIFNTNVTIVNSGTGYLQTASAQPDIFNAVNGSLTATTTGSGTIRFANSVAGTQFNGNITLASDNGGGFYFSNGAGGSATLASGRTLSLGIFNAGELRMLRFTYTDSNPVVLNLTGSNTTLRLGPSTTFPGNVDFRASQLYLNGIQVGGIAYLEKNGATTDNGLGGNIFSGETTIVNAGSGDLVLGNATADIFNSDLTVSNTGTARILMANNSANNQFNGNITISSNSGSGIYFCDGTNSNATISNGLVQIGAAGFSVGELRLRRITQTGSTPQIITLSGTATLVCGPQTTWNGSVDFSSPGVTLSGTTFNGSSTAITKNGTGTNSSAGGNIFTSTTTTITNSGTGTFRLANTTADTFNGDVTFSVSNGALEPAFNGTNIFSGNITLENTVAITIGAGTGTLLFEGSNVQSVNRTGTAAVTFRRFTLNKIVGHVTLNTPVNVSTLGTFTNGNIITTTTNLLNFLDGAVTSGGSNTSYVDGPVRKTGNEAFSFPTGDNGVYRPIGISAPAAASHHFTAQYFRENQGYGMSMETGLQTISGCEYWTLDRTNGTSNVSVTLNWNSTDCTGEYINDPDDLRVVRWNGTTWVNHGNGGITGGTGVGSVTSGGVVTSFSPFTIGSSSMDNPLPVELTSFSAQQMNYGVLLQWTTASELNNDYFTIEKSKNGTNFENLTTIKGAGTSITQNQYEFIDRTPFKHLAYYRLKQTDFDGQYSYSKIIVIYQQTEDKLEVYPNPATRTKLVEVNKMGRFVVLNDLGVIVLRATDADQIDISNLAAGVYVVKSETGEHVRLIVH